MSLPKPGQFSVQDASLLVSQSLPNANATTVDSTVIDLGLMHGISSRPLDFEILVEIPVVTTAQLPNTSVETYTVQASALANFASGVVTLGSATQTGNTGAAAQDLRVKVPGNCPEFVRLQIASDAAGANASAASATIQLVF